MSETFSESWHRIANQRIQLRPTLRVQRQFFRGERWYVIADPFSNQFFRVRPGGYEFLARLSDGRTVEECWKDALEQNPDSAPGQEEVIQLLAQLYNANLIRSDLPADSAKLFERQKKRKQRELRSRLMSILFVRIPLWDPDTFLKRSMPLIGWLFGIPGAILWLVVVLAAGKVALDHFDTLLGQGQSILAPSNLGLLYVGMALIKLLHEFGHAYLCRRFGGEVHTMGVMLLVLSPLPFVDATSSWGFRSRWHRMLVGAGGMIVEVFVAALAMFVWAGTGDGVVHSLAYNMIFVASVSTVLFNANPLLRFDGYYILSDLLDMPNLHQRSRRMWRHIFEHFLFGWKKSKSPANSRQEAAILTTFGALSGIYRVFVFGGIILFIAGQFLLLGMVLAVIGLVTWLVVPAGKLVHYLATNQRIERVRTRAVAVTVGGLAAIVLLLAWVPFPHWFSAPGVVRAESYGGVFSEADGAVASIERYSGVKVNKGDVLLNLENPELALQIDNAEAQLAEAQAAEEKAISSAQSGGVDAARKQVAALEGQVARLQEMQGSLQVRAPLDGVWVAPGLESAKGVWLGRGMMIGEIVDPASFRFSAVVSQDDAAFLFGEELSTKGIRIKGQAMNRLEVSNAVIIEAQQRQLPSPALGWAGGGEIAVKQDDSGGTQAQEAFFEFRATVVPDTEGEVALLHGRSGRIRCALPPEPLLAQGYRELRQLLQKRFQL